MISLNQINAINDWCNIDYKGTWLEHHLCNKSYVETGYACNVSRYEFTLEFDIGITPWLNSEELTFSSEEFINPILENTLELIVCYQNFKKW